MAEGRGHSEHRYRGYWELEELSRRPTRREALGRTGVFVCARACVCGNRKVESARHAAFTAFTPAISNHQLQMRRYIHRYVLRIDAHRCSPVVHWLLLRTQPSAAVILSPHLLAPAWPHFPEEIDLHVSETPTRSQNSAEVALITQASRQAELSCRWLAHNAV